MENKRGLILEGGAMRGMFTAGVMDVLMENGIDFDGVIGVSAGAAFGCNYKSRQIGRVLRYNTRFCRDKRYSGLGVWLKTGNIYSTDFCYNEVPLKYDVFDFDTFEANPMEFYVVCTDVETGQPVYHSYKSRHDHGFDWIRASASLPLASRIVEIDGRKLLDGGISDSIPVKYFQSLGYTKNIAVLTRPLGYEKRPNKLMPLARRVYRDYPNFVATMETRHLRYNETLAYIAQQEQSGALYVLRPETPIQVSTIEKDPKNLQTAYTQGQTTAQTHLKEIQTYLAENKS